MTPINSNSSNWVLDHVGHAVSEINSAIDFYTSKLGMQLLLTESLESEKVDVAFLQPRGTQGANGLIELIAPLNGNTILSKFIEKRGPGLHHLCYRVNSVRETLDKLANEGINLIDKSPRIGSRGLNVAFLHPKSTLGVLVELCSDR